MNWFDSWALSLATFIPIVGMAIVLAIPRAKEELIKQVILFRFDYDNVDKLQFSVNKSWIDVISSRYHMGLDGISLPLVILTMGISLLCVIYSWDHFPEPHNPKAFLALLLVLETGMVGTFLAEDLIL